MEQPKSLEKARKIRNQIKFLFLLQKNLRNLQRRLQSIVNSLFSREGNITEKHYSEYGCVSDHKSGVHALKRFLRVSRSVTEHFRKENKEISIQLASKLIISRSHHRTIIFISRASQTWDTLLRVGSRLPFLSKGNTGTWVKKESFVL